MTATWHQLTPLRLLRLELRRPTLHLACCSGTTSTSPHRLPTQAQTVAGLTHQPPLSKPQSSATFTQRRLTLRPAVVMVTHFPNLNCSTVKAWFSGKCLKLDEHARFTAKSKFRGMKRGYSPPFSQMNTLEFYL